jgi:hypothetical protein
MNRLSNNYYSIYKKYWNIKNKLYKNFNHIEPDEDGLYNGLILHHTQYSFLWRLSWLLLSSGMFAIYRGYYDLAATPLGILITSLNYWRKPDYSWRRYLDIGYVHIGLIYQSIRAYNSEYCIPYYTILSVGIICYPISVYYHKKNSWKSTILHGMLHICGNISNFVLYSGEIKNLL